MIDQPLAVDSFAAGRRTPPHIDGLPVALDSVDMVEAISKGRIAFGENSEMRTS